MNRKATNHKKLLAENRARMNKQGLIMKYFVLKPKGNDIFAEASRKAMRAYAAHIIGANEQFANELRAWADSETPELNQQ